MCKKSQTYQIARANAHDLNFNLATLGYRGAQ